MRVFVTGATGFIGSAIVQELIGAGHRVLGLVRSDANAQKLTAAGAQVHWGTLDDLASLKRGAAESEGVIHTAFNHDFVNVSREAAAKADVLAIEAIGDALAGSGRPFITSSGTGMVPGRTRTETDEAAPHIRHPSDKATLALAAREVRAMVMGLPPSVPRPGRSRPGVRAHRDRPGQRGFGLHRSWDQPLAGGTSSRCGQALPAGAREGRLGKPLPRSCGGGSADPGDCQGHRSSPESASGFHGWCRGHGTLWLARSLLRPRLPRLQRPHPRTARLAADPARTPSGSRPPLLREPSLNQSHPRC